MPSATAAARRGTKGKCSSLLARSREFEPRALREQVTSRAGTTAAALAVFEAADLRGIVRRAVQAASARPVRDELADVLIYLVRLADRLDVDLDEAVHTKLRVNAERYPVDKARGRSDKYDRL